MPTPPTWFDEDYDDDHIGFQSDDDLPEDDCGLMHDGQCTMAGSEHCDFSCPNRNSELFVGSRAWREKHRRKRKAKPEADLFSPTPPDRAEG